MQIETTSEADMVCKDLIGKAYEAAHRAYPADGMFSGIDKLWEQVEEALGRKGALGLCTTGAEDSEAVTVLGEVFEEACHTAKVDDFPTDAYDYVDYQQLWERICAVLGVNV